jgi:hypothetical protein
MDTDDTRNQQKLPVTAEVGGEGGSFADATLQVEAVNGPPGNDRVDPKAVSAGEGTAAAVAAEGEQVGRPADEVKHATEPPAAR